MNLTERFNRDFAMTGNEVARLMRRHGVTIRELKARTGFTMKRIREICNAGERVSLAGVKAMDWHEAITGEVPPRMMAAWLAARRWCREH